MRFEFEAAKELWNGRVNHERIKNVDVITNKDARPLGIKAQRAMDFKSHSDETQNIAEENALRQVILSRIYENREKKKECADQCKMNPADGPQKKRAKGGGEIFFFNNCGGAGGGCGGSQRAGR